MTESTKRYKTMSLDVEAVAAKIENQWSRYLKPAPKGLYYDGTLDPILTPDKQYYQYSGDSSVAVDVADIFQTPTSPIYEKLRGGDSIIAVTSRMLQAGPGAWSVQPSIPYTGMYAVQECLNEFISTHVNNHFHNPKNDLWSLLVDNDQILSTALQWGMPNFSATGILGWMKSHTLQPSEITECLCERIVLHIRSITSPLYERLGAFIGPHVDNVYEVRMCNSMISIHQGPDWRALQWEREQLIKSMMEREVQ